MGGRGMILCVHWLRSRVQIMGHDIVCEGMQGAQGCGR